jgi:osmotically-inducible protein OsmY
MKENINEHDMTKKMIDIVRGGYTKRLIKEDDQKDTVDLKPEDDTFREDLGKLRDQIDSSAQITNYKVYTENSDVLMEGTLLKAADSGIEFSMSRSQRDVKTNMNNIEMDDEVQEMLKALTGFYKNWYDDWSRRLAERDY